MPIRGTEILYATPVIRRHPSEWPHKDDLVSMLNVSPVVQEAVNRSLVRHVSNAIIVRGGNVLLVKPNRGFSEGRWALPGGFINFGESPEESLKREAKEETNLAIRVGRLVLSDSTVYSDHYVLALIYLCTGRGRPRADPTEIAEVRWFPLDEAIAVTKQKWFVHQALVAYKKSLALPGRR
ncbi:MAG: NUDIX domain-containing protein [Candidatus Aenigmarchaeota archaeon]|nr:NUDIX domain-containing protein [Candidatus Aenigmarchaeota archaeon]